MSKQPTLLERAKPELLVTLSSFAVKFPLTRVEITSALVKHYFVIDLPYGIVMEIENMTGQRIWDNFYDC